MARLQILELPEGSADNRPPFILVIDQAPRDSALFRAFHEDIELNDGVAARVGARGVLVFEDTVEIPANEIAEVFRTEVRESVGDLYDSARRSLESGIERVAAQRAEAAG
ncbi:hypothetical protein [Streptomyces sp. NPDC058155]|uniref:hypothetical protein n=1 Tax=Streptomyces sp. NPDC058155 TaxID=3346359 RepID=UPI0036E3D956